MRQREAKRAEARRQYELKVAKLEARAEDQELDEETVRAMLPEFVDETPSDVKVRRAVDAVQKFTEPPAAILRGLAG